MEDNQLFDFLDCYIDLKKEDIIKYQEQKKKCLDEYILREKERKVEAGFMVDKYNIINNVKDFINENYYSCVNVFTDKQLSYVDKNELDDYYSGFCYCGSQCIDRDINVYLLRYNMKKLIERYPKLNDYFDNLDLKYRELLKDNDIVDNKKIKKLVGNTI